MTLYCPNCGSKAPDEASFCNFCGSSLHNAKPSPSGGSVPPNVKKCFYCSKPFVGQDAFYFRCRYCGQDFCTEHRLPENHLCKSNPMRRTKPSSSMPYYSTGGNYKSSTYNRGGGGSSFLNLSKQGRNLIILIVSGLLIGAIAAYIPFQGSSLLAYLIQVNSFDLQTNWYVPLVTSIIVVIPPIPQFIQNFGYSGLEDVFFNAISVFFVDGLLRYAYTTRQYYFVFLVTGVAGNILSLLAYSSNIVSFGASGGIFGLVAGALTSEYALSGRVNRGLIIWFVFIFIYSTFLSANIDIYAHLGGAATGLLCGYFAGRSLKSKRGIL